MFAWETRSEEDISLSSSSPSTGTYTAKNKLSRSSHHGSDMALTGHNHFLVQKEISRGTMSTVYYCTGGLALKSMGEEACPDAVAIYRNDLQVLHALGKHPYIVKLIDTTDEAMITHISTAESEAVHNC